MNERLKHKIDKVKIDWDKEALWDELEPQLPRRQRFSWRSLLGGLVLLGLVWCGRKHIVSTHSENETNTVLSIAQANDKTACLTEKQATKPFVPQTIDRNNKPSPISSNTITQTSHQLENIEESRITNNNTEVGYSGSSVLGKGYPKQSSWPKSATITNSKTHQYSETNIATLTNSATLTEVPTPIPDTEQKAPWIIEKPTGEILAMITPDAINTSSVTLDLKQQKKRGITSPLPGLSPVEILPLEQQDKAYLVGELKPVIYPLTGPKKGIYIDVSMGAGVLHRSARTSILTPTESENVLEHKAAEKTQFNSFASLGIGYQTKSGLFLETGLMYNEKQEQLNWQQTTNVDTIQYFNDRAYYSLDAVGDTTYYDGYSERIEKTNRQIRHWNKLKTYQLPLIIGYQQQLQQFSWRGSLGMTLNLASNFEGRVVDPNQEVVDNPELGLMTSIGYLANLGVGYQIWDQHQVFVDAAYHRSPQFTLLAIEQHYESFNLRLGVRVSLGKASLDQGIAKSQ